jgi:hypothetical protein
MGKYFVPYEIALELYKLGFEEECLRYWNDYGKNSDNRYRLLSFIDDWSQDIVNAPLKAQAFEWFRINHKIHSGVYPYYDEYVYQIKDFNSVGNMPLLSKMLSYEDAEIACLYKLIEICKNKE